jgi:hypothetical protein
MKVTFETVLIKRNGKLEHTIKAKEDIFNTLVNDLPEGSIIEVFANTKGNKGSNTQLAKIHAMIKQLAQDIGDDPGAVKEQIKIQAMIKGSLADCDKDELNSVIQVILQIGDLVGSNLREY